MRNDSADLFNFQTARGERSQDLLCRDSGIEPAAEIRWRQHDDLAVVVRRHVPAGSVVSMVKASPTVGSVRAVRRCEPFCAFQHEQPLVLTLACRIAAGCELVKTVGCDQAVAAGELSAFRADGL